MILIFWLLLCLSVSLLLGLELGWIDQLGGTADNLEVSLPDEAGAYDLVSLPEVASPDGTSHSRQLSEHRGLAGGFIRKAKVPVLGGGLLENQLGDVQGFLQTAAILNGGEQNTAYSLDIRMSAPSGSDSRWQR